MRRKGEEEKKDCRETWEKIRETNSGSIILDDLDGIRDNESSHLGSDGNDFGKGKVKLSNRQEKKESVTFNDSDVMG
jgi:hypothetical protein